MNTFLSRRHWMAWLTLSSTASAGAAPSALAAAFAPTGRLRASINLGNPILAKRDAASGQVGGVSVDMAQAQLLELPDCRHSPHRDRPEHVIAAATEFIYRHAGRSATHRGA